MTWNPSSFKGSSSKFLSTLGLCLVTSSALCAATSSSQEAFFLKRITEYWKEGDYDVAKSQILTFFKKYPESGASDSLHTMLADLYMQERNYEEALRHYLQISSEETQNKISYNKSISLFETKRYSELIEHVSRALASPIRPAESETMEFFLAESLLRKGMQQTDPSEKKAYLTSALPHYKHLLDGKFAEHALTPAAEISHRLGLKEDACHYYSLLVEKRPHEREALLFQVASLQEDFKPKEAIKTYGQVYKLHGKKAPEAAFLQLQLLFKEQKYKDLLLYQEEAMRHVAEDKLPIAHYWIGKSLFYLEDYAQATSHLMKTYTCAELNPAEYKLLTKSLISCAAKTKNAELLQTLIHNWEEKSASDSEMAEAYLLQYQILSSNNKAAAAACLRKILEKFPAHKDRESILYNLANLEYLQKEWEASEETFSVLLKEYPSSRFSTTVWRQRINCAIEEAKGASAETAHIKQGVLANVLKEALSTKKVLNASERKEYQLAYCKLLMQLSKEEEALTELHEFLDNNPKDENLGWIYYMMAQAYAKSDEEPSLFISYAEKALSTDDSLPQKAQLQATLFNAYLTMAGSAQEHEKSQLMTKAADHLFASYANGNKIKRDNLLWLANFYYEVAKEEKLENKNSTLACTKTIALVEDLLGIHSYPPSLKLSAERLSQESEMLKLAEVLGWVGKDNEKIDVLEVLTYQQKSQPDLPWKYPRKALFDLARSYENAGKSEEAIQTYDYLVESSEYSTSYIAHLAMLERARLKFAGLTTAVDEEAPEWQSVLNDLKDLELKKKLSSEPIHLEAALSYVEFKTSHLPEEKKKQKTLQLLQLVKENFSSEQDPKVKEYLAAASLYPEKAGLHTSYMRLIDSLIYRTKAEIAEQNQDGAQAKILFFQAKQELQAIPDRSQLPSELLNRIHSNTEAMEKRL